MVIWQYGNMVHEDESFSAHIQQRSFYKMLGALLTASAVSESLRAIGE